MCKGMYPLSVRSPMFSIHRPCVSVCVLRVAMSFMLCSCFYYFLSPLQTRRLQIVFSYSSRWLLPSLTQQAHQNTHTQCFSVLSYWHSYIILWSSPRWKIFLNVNMRWGPLYMCTCWVYSPVGLRVEFRHTFYPHVRLVYSCWERDFLSPV